MDFSSLPADTAHRFRAVADILKSRAPKLPDQPKLLDVGGYPGTFARVISSTMPRWQTTTVDKPAETLPDYVSYTGGRLPFETDSFDAVVSIDTFEHLAPGDRGNFLSELCRVGKSLVVLAAPFHHESTAAAERILANAWEKLFRSPHPWLDEHVRHGLPVLELSVAGIPSSHGVTEVLPSYDLSAWVMAQSLSILRKRHGALDNAWKGYEAAFATAPTPAVTSVPYRWVVVAESGEPARDFRGRLTPGSEMGGDALELARLFGRLMELETGELSERAGLVAPLLIETRLKEALAAAEQEVLRLQNELKNPRPPVQTGSGKGLLKGIFGR